MKRLLFFDLWGDIFDVSLLTIEDEFFEVRAEAEYTRLGGEGLDNRIVVHFLDIFKRRTVKDASNNHQSVAKFKGNVKKQKDFFLHDSKQKLKF